LRASKRTVAGFVDAQQSVGYPVRDRHVDLQRAIVVGLRDKANMICTS
jgi:hypothetical protein